MGYAREQALERGALLIIQRREELILDLGGRALDFVQELRAALGDLDDVSAPVLGVAASADQAVCFEIVEQRDEVARVDVQSSA